MSMGVDLSTPLTSDEAAYLAERGRYAELQSAAERHDQDVNELLAGNQGDGTGPVVRNLSTNLQQIEEPEALLRRLREMGVNVQVVDEEPDGDDEDDNDVAPYENWKVSELDAELKRRNLPVTGDKVSKANALYAYDERA